MEVTLVLGASENPNRTSHTAVTMLAQKGYDIIAVGSKPGTIGTTKIITELPEDITIDTISLYINPGIQNEMEEKILKLNPRRIIFNPGTENMELALKAQKKGIETLEACTLVLLSLQQY